MTSVYLREQKRYTQEMLMRAFCCPEHKTVRILRRLKAYGVLKAVKATDAQKDLTDLLEEDVEVVDVKAGAEDHFYVFTFVGVIVVEGIVLKCYPKYLLHVDAPKAELKQILKVLEKCHAKEQIVRMHTESNNGSGVNMLAVMLFLLQDYFESGSYTNTQEIIETNGSGDILWEKTIHETFMILSNERPYYPELLTRRRINDDFDYFKRLHECILTCCSRELKHADLTELFNIGEVNLSDKELEDFGETEYVLDRIRRELDVQFNTRKQLLLKGLYAYIAQRGGQDEIDCMRIFGTNSFNLVWERVCAEVLDNQLKKPIGGLVLPVPLSEKYHSRRQVQLIDLIEKPVWSGVCADGSQVSYSGKDTLIPDIVFIVKDGGAYQFVISDAKYYNLQLERGKPLRGQPGIESITKQYLYQLAYQPFVAEHHFSAIRNCFLMPTQRSEIVCKGEVSLAMLDSLGLQKIQIRLLPAAMVYEHYLSGTKLDMRLLAL